MGLIRILILAVAAVLAYTLFKRLIAGGSRAGRPEMGDERLARLVQDPQCGVYVDPEESVHRKVPDGDLFFCSQDCADAYMAGHGAQKEEG